MNRPRSLRDVATVSRIDEQEFTRTYRYINGELALVVEPGDPLRVVDRILPDLALGDETRYLAREILRDAKGTAATSGKSPMGLAATAVYAAGQLTGEKPTQLAVGAAADLSDVTTRNRYQELIELTAAGQ